MQPDSIEVISDFFQKEICSVCTSYTPKQNQDKIKCISHYMCIECRLKWYRFRSTLVCKCEETYYSAAEKNNIEEKLKNVCAICYKNCKNDEKECYSCTMRICSSCSKIQGIDGNCNVCSVYICPLCKKRIGVNYIIHKDQEVSYLVHLKCLR